MNLVFTFLFFALVISIFFVVLEWIATLSFIACAYTIGPVVMRGKFRSKAPFNKKPEIQSNEVCFSIQGNNTVLMRPKFGFFSAFTPFYWKSKISKSDDGLLDVEARVPFSSTVFVVILFVFVVAAFVKIVLLNQLVVAGCSLCIGLGFVAVFVFVPWQIESSRFKRAIQDLRSVRE